MDKILVNGKMNSRNNTGHQEPMLWCSSSIRSCLLPLHAPLPEDGGSRDCPVGLQLESQDRGWSPARPF